MQELEPTKPDEKGAGKMGWIIALVVALFIIWVVYTGFQTQQVDTRSMPGNMPGMNMGSTDTIPTEMPSNMPGMNYP